MLCVRKVLSCPFPHFYCLSHITTNVTILFAYSSRQQLLPSFLEFCAGNSRVGQAKIDSLAHARRLTAVLFGRHHSLCFMSFSNIKRLIDKNNRFLTALPSVQKMLHVWSPVESITSDAFCQSLF